jgi:thiamine-phosphate pyrophosphorylase
MRPGRAPSFGVYLVTDRRSTGGRDLVESVEEALQGGITCVQVREKDLNGRDLLRLASDMRAVTREYGARLFINDRVDVAVLSDADGVHLGQAGMPAAAARKIASANMLIGVSAHGLSEAMGAERDGADFITLGPIYATPSKAQWGSPLGVGVLKEARRALKIPIYAIGGINEARVEEAIRAGADGVALISAVLGGRDIRASAAGIVKALDAALAGAGI